MIHAYPWHILKLIHDHPLAPEGRFRTTLPVEQNIASRHTNHTTLAYITACLLSAVGCIGMIWGMASVSWVIAVAGGWLVVVLYAAGLAVLADALAWKEG